MKTPGYRDDGNITLLAKGVELRGEIKVEGTVRIDGRLEGEVQTKGEVIVGEEGLVQGTIFVGSLISSGRIKATVTVTERIQLMKTAILIGEVHGPVMSMEDGAKFQGLSDMGVTAWAEAGPCVAGHVRHAAGQREPEAVNGKEADL